MTSPKKIEINQSSLLGLKAELERKRKEVESGKCSNLSNRFNVKPKLKKREKKSQEADKAIKKVQEVTEDEVDLLVKSRIALETKAKTYETLSGKGILGDDQIDSTEFLVDFKKKQEEEGEERIEDDLLSEESEKEWVDYVDCLGRTRRCHRDDYETIKEGDSSLKAKLFGRSYAGASDGKEVAPVSLKLSAEEEKKEAVRQKWEEQEQILLGKKDLHYQDVLFNEARSHGVGYYEFSTDERDRSRQQEELKRTREETLKRQDAARDASEKKKKQTEERLRAARKRKRERLGLLPEEEDTEKEAETETENKSAKDSENRRKIESPHQEKRDPAKPISIRPWDVGKEGAASVLSQEEWIGKKRTERIAEFAPPSDSRLFRKTKRHRKPEDAEAETEDNAPDRGVRIAPPQSYHSTPIRKISPNVEKSIEEGLKFLREQTQRIRDQARGGLDFI